MRLKSAPYFVWVAARCRRIPKPQRHLKKMSTHTHTKFQSISLIYLPLCLFGFRTLTFYDVGRCRRHATRLLWRPIFHLDMSSAALRPRPHTGPNWHLFGRNSAKEKISQTVPIGQQVGRTSPGNRREKKQQLNRPNIFKFSPQSQLGST